LNFVDTPRKDAPLLAIILEEWYAMRGKRPQSQVSSNLSDTIKHLPSITSATSTYATSISASSTVTSNTSVQQSAPKRTPTDEHMGEVRRLQEIEQRLRQSMTPQTSQPSTTADDSLEHYSVDFSGDEDIIEDIDVRSNVSSPPREQAQQRV